jgi:hypothetical protein
VVRHYKRKPKRIDPDKRMIRAVELRAQGLSLRQIAERLLCTHPTVLADLRRWDCDHANVTPLAVNRDGKSVTPGATDLPPESTAEPANIISLNYRRKRA